MDTLFSVGDTAHFNWNGHKVHTFILKEVEYYRAWSGKQIPVPSMYLVEMNMKRADVRDDDGALLNNGITSLSPTDLYRCRMVLFEKKFALLDGRY